VGEWRSVCEASKGGRSKERRRIVRGMALLSTIVVMKRNSRAHLDVTGHGFMGDEGDRLKVGEGGIRRRNEKLRSSNQSKNGDLER